MGEVFGNLDGIGDTQLVVDEDLPRDDSSIGMRMPDEGNVLWDYQTDGRIGGIPVVDEDRGLPISRDDVVYAAFVLDRRPRSMMLWLSPDDEDSANRTKYDDLLALVYDGRAEIVDEMKQFDPSKGKFIVWVRYNELCYRLHKRFEYLREEEK